MNNIQKRFILFLFGCIVIRLIFALIAKNIDETKLQYFGYISLLPVIGWFYLIFFGQRNTGPEVFGDIIWWKNYRIIHALNWSAFAYLAINKNKNAWLVIFTDTIMGLIFFLNYHIKQNNLQFLY